MKGYRKLLSVMLVCSMLVAMPSSEAFAADAAAEVNAETEENVMESDIGTEEKEEPETENMASERDGGEKEAGETVSEDNGSEDAGEGTEGNEADEPKEEAAEPGKETADPVDILPREEHQEEQAEAVMAETTSAEGGETSGSCGANVTWRLVDGVLTISGSGEMYSYYSGSGNGFVPWYEYRDNIKRTVVEEGVSTIGGCAFAECSSLTSIELPSGITTIGDLAFNGCSGLTSIELPPSVTTIGAGAFEYCSGLTSIELPSGVTTIGGLTFYHCSGLTSIELPSGVTTIGERTFSGCSNLISIGLPSKVTTIEQNAFEGCSGLTSIELPPGVRTIGAGAFWGCSSLTNMELPSGITTIGYGFFAGCNSLTSIELPSGVTTIGEMAFDGCRNLTSVKLPSGVTTIGDWAFCECSSLTSMKLPSDITTIGGNAFIGCSSLTSIELPSGVTTIEYRTFSDCSKLKSIKLPSRITTIEQQAFYGCGSLTDVYYGGSESDWRAITIVDGNEPLTSATLHCALNDSESDGLKWGLDANGVLTISGTGKMADYHEPDSPAPWNGQRDQIKTIVISQGVASIGASAFSGCTNLTEITIPKSVVSIGDSAFSGCENLARVRFLGSKEQLESIIVGTDNEPYYKASRSWIEGGSNDPDDSDPTLAVQRRSFAFSDPPTVWSDWGWNYILERNSTEYIHEISTVALVLSAAAERSQSDIESILAGNQFGVDADLTTTVNDDSSPYNPACTFAHKTINNGGKTEHIIIIVGRGTSSFADGVTDYCSITDNFRITANNIWLEFATWLNEKEIGGEKLASVIGNGNVKFFVTGHSLGGAVANRIAYKLTQDYGHENVYAYTFASPPTEGQKSTYAPNIFNVLCPSDPVPYLGAFTDGRYGDDLWFADSCRLPAGFPILGFFDNHVVESYMKHLLNISYYRFQTTMKSGGGWCPVDLKIYNSFGQLVGSVTNNVVDKENVTDSVVIVLSGENNDEKNFYFLRDDTYTIEFTGTSAGTLKYTIRDTYADKSRIDEKVFTNVTLTTGKKMTSSVSVWDKTNPDISVEDKIDTPQVQLLVLDENDNIVREVLPDGTGTEIPYTGPNEVLPGDIPADGKIPDGLWIAGVADSYTYTGAAIKPEIRVYDGKKRLQPGKDYTASYKNNMKANDAANPSTAPAVVVKGRGNYAGTETAAFQITSVALEDSSVVAEDITVACNKKVQKKVPVVTYNGRKLAKNRDFTVSYPSTATDAYKEPGNYEILLTAKAGGNFSGTRMVTCTITDSTLLDKVNVKKIPNQTYTGKAIEPELMVSYKNKPLIKGTDYVVSYTDHTEVGTAKVVLTGIGKYAGTRSVSFKITGTSLKGAVLSGIVNKTYNGSYQRQSMTVALHGRTLVEGTDYEVAYANNKDVGKASVTIKGKGAYTGTVKKTFQIGKFDIAANMDGRFTAEVKQEAVPYAKGGAKPTVAVRFRTGDGRWQTLAEGRDYTLSYRNHTALNDGSRADRRPVVTVKGKGSFRGIYGIALGYKIMAQDIGQLTLTAQDKTYQNRKNVFTTKVAVTDLDGKVLKAGTDYNKTVVYTYAKETAVITAGGGTAVRAAGEAVDKNDIIPAGTVLKVQVQAKEGSNYTGMLTGEYRITQAAISSASVSVPKQVYTGQPITLEKSMLTVKVKGKPLDVSQYEIVPGSYKNNVKKGTASVTIRGVDNYGGTKNVRFTIRARGFLWWWR